MKSVLVKRQLNTNLAAVQTAVVTIFTKYFLYAAHKDMLPWRVFFFFYHLCAGIDSRHRETKQS